MAVKYLSEEWVNEVQQAINNNESFKSAAGSQTARIQQIVTGSPEGETKYWFKLEGGEANLGLGEIENPDATISQDYETSVALAKNELTGTAAYMSGKLRVTGDLMKLMQMQGVFGQLPAVVKDIDVEY